MEIIDDSTIVNEITKRIKRKFHLFDNKRVDIHISDLIYCITKKYWKDTQPATQILDDDALMFSIGLGLERVLLEDDANNPNRPPVIAVDGVFFNGDYELTINEDELGELKTTRAYYNKDNVPTHGYPNGWVKQIAGYAYAYKKTNYHLAVFQVISAKLIGKQFKFTQDELDLYWKDYILPRRKAYLEARLYNKPPQPFRYNDGEWECNRCAFQLNCAMSIVNKDYLPEIINKLPDTFIINKS